MSSLRYSQARSTFGRLWIAETDAGVAATSRVEALDRFLTPLRRRFRDTVLEPGTVDTSWLEEGRRPRLDLTGLPAFDAAVYRVVAEIPMGETATYGEVAARVRSPAAARAVGNAIARCPLFPAVPCHRVVRAADGWSGWGGDPALKRRLLDDERRRVGGPAPRRAAPPPRRSR